MPDYATIWTTDGCERCAAVRCALEHAGYEIEVRALAALVDGREPDLDALGQLALQNREAPVVRVRDRGDRPGGRFLPWHRIVELARPSGAADCGRGSCAFRRAR